MKSLLTKHYWKLLNLLAIIAFSWQLYGIIHDWVVPTFKTTEISNANLSDFEFPVVFKVCLKPGFNSTYLKEEGYNGISGYFVGESKFNSSLVGWAGHNNDSGVTGTVQGEFAFLDNNMFITRSSVKIVPENMESVSPVAD